MENILWLHDADLQQTPHIGGKAARLGELVRRGFPVPAGFCITTAAYRQHMQSAAPSQLDAQLVQEIETACTQLGAATLAVRSSSPSEDLDAASYAGQYSTYLNIAPSDVPARVLDCWASLATPRAAAYRQHGDSAAAADMAVIVQIMIPCTVSGVAFSIDPVTGDNTIVVEAAAGLGENVVGGQVTPHRYVLERTDDAPPGDDLLSVSTLRQLKSLVLGIEETFGGPQDIEWGVWRDALYILQARPITVQPTGDDVFTDNCPAGDLWTAAFFNERFPQPVSPLGWSLLKDEIERYALREPLQFLGAPGCETWQLTRLYRGHPYANMRVFQTIYKVFPDALLPDDALRFFTNRDAGLRRKVPYPRGLYDPRFLISMLRHFVRDPANWSPLHNWRLWQRFTQEYDRGLAAAAAQIDTQRADLLAIAGAIQWLNARLLAIHRWSLTDADIFYSLLRRLLRSWLSREEGDRLAASLTTGLDNLSLQTNAALDALRSLEHDDSSTPERRAAALDAFLARFGHRSPSLDIYHATFADEPGLVASLLQSTTRSAPLERDSSAYRQAYEHVHAALATRALDRILPLRWLFLRWVLSSARRYLPLREDQRFYWQKGLALLRHIYLRLGLTLVERGILQHDDDVFFLTASEVAAHMAVAPPSPLPSADGRGEGGRGDGVRQRVASRRAIFDRLTTEWKSAPAASYPPFLQGNAPLSAPAAAGNSWRGTPVSPGIGRGPAHVLLAHDNFASVPDGCILVAPGADPAWTPLFARLAGLVLEFGGQLSHGAVVAREYHLPAVAGLPGAASIIHNGDIVTVDGSLGTVVRETGDGPTDA